MTTTRPKLAAAKRDVTGKKVAAIRRAGRLPAVVFGHGISSSNVSIDAHEFDQLQRHSGANVLVDLSVDGGRATPVLIHGVQHHAVNRRPLHVDLYVVRMTEELTVDVPVDLTGVSAAVDMHGGTLVREMETVKVRALPDHLPQRFELSIEPLVDFESRIHVRDLTIPAGVTLVSDPDETVAHVLAPRIEEELAAPAAEGEVAEGEAAEGAAGAEGETATEG